MAATDVVIRFVGDASRAVDAANKVANEYSGLSRKLTRTGVAMTAGITVPFIALGKVAVDAASNLNESMSKSDAIFGRNAAAIQKWAAGAAQDFGQSKQQALENAASFGNMFRQMDIGLPTATRMSTKMVELASDFASFHNADITEVLQAQQAAFRGEYDAVQRFVPTINAAAVETKALAMTGKDNAAQLTAQEKATATYALMLQDAGKATGDFDKTAGGAANQQRILAAQMENVKAQIGAALIPAFQSVVGIIGTVAGAFAELPQEVQTGIIAFAAFAAALGPILTIAGNIKLATQAIGTGLSALKGAFDTARLAGMYFVEAIAAAPAAFAGLAAGIAVVFAAGYGLHVLLGKDLGGSIRDAMDAGKQFGASLVTNASQIADLTAKHDQLTASLRDLKSARVDDFDSAVANAAAQRTVKAAIAEVEGQQRAAAVAERERLAAVNDLATGTTNLATATDVARQALNEMSNAVLAAQGGALGYEAAQLQVEAAQKRVDDLIANGSLPTSLEYRQATNELEQSKIRAAGAALTMQNSEADLAALVNQKNVPALTAMRDQLILAEQAHHDATGATQAQIDKINGLIDRANAIPPEKTVHATADTAQAERDINEVARPRTVPLTVQMGPGAWNLPRPFQTGGIVPGARGAPQLAVVHGGEKIIPTNAVRAADRGATSGGGAGRTFNITINVPPEISAAEVGARTVDAIRQYERVAGKAWRS